MTSPYPELKALSDEERETEICHSVSVARDWLVAIVHKGTNKEYCLVKAQSHLDRIKQLVLTRGDNEK